MTREQELESLYEDLVYFGRRDIEKTEKDLGQAYIQGSADAYLLAATWLRKVLDMEVTNE